MILLDILFRSMLVFNPLLVLQRRRIINYVFDFIQFLPQIRVALPIRRFDGKNALLHSHLLLQARQFRF